MAYNVARHPQQTTNVEIRPARSVHLVRPGETLDTIARRYGTTGAQIIALNNHQLGANGAAFQPGMRLEI